MDRTINVEQQMAQNNQGELTPMEQAKKSEASSLIG
jgi:hypothetical protein